MSYQLRNLIQTRAGGLRPVVEAVNALLESARVRYDSETGLRAFGRPPDETIPVERKQLTTFRTRLGTLIEYQFGTIIDRMLQDEYQDDLRPSFVVSHQYPDFYLRDAGGNVLLRVDSKALHDEADEYSARFDLPIAEIQPDDDLVIYVAWRWTTRTVAGSPIVFPEV